MMHVPTRSKNIRIEKEPEIRWNGNNLVLNLLKWINIALKLRKH